MISAADLNLTLGGQSILSDVSLDLGQGEVVALCGPNGAGKSTLLACLAGEHPSCVDRIKYGDTEISGLAANQLARRRVVLEQSPTLAAEFLVRELIELGAPIDVAPGDVRRLSDLVLGQLGIEDLEHRMVSTLSGGQQHRAHLARVLVQLKANQALGHPCALFLDEPTAALDIRHQITVLSLVTELAREGTGVLVVLHDLNLAAAFADRVVLMKEGVIAHAGTPEQVLTSVTLSTVYETPISVNFRSDGQFAIHPDLPTRATQVRCA